MINAKIDTKDFERSLKELTKSVNKTAEESIIELAQAGSRQLAIRTEPYGLNSKAKDIAEKAIFKDIYKVYQNVGVTYNLIKQESVKKANAYAYCMNHGQTRDAEKIAESVLGGKFDVGTVDNGIRLNANRNSRGRVDKANSPVGVKDKGQVEELKARKKTLAGMAKAGWVQAGNAIKSKAKIPAWLKKNDSGLGSGVVERNEWKTVVTLINHVKYASNVITETKIQLAIRNAYKNHLKKLTVQMDKLTKRF